jgi:hypothetical protein
MKLSNISSDKKPVAVTLFFALILLTPLISANTFGYNYLDNVVTGTQIINGTNYSINVNHSDYWDNLDTPADISYDDLSGGDVEALGYIGYFNGLAGVVGGLAMDGNPWYLGGTDLEIDEDLQVNNTYVEHDIMPVNTLTGNIGSGALRWLTLWVQSINAEDIDAYNLNLSQDLRVDGTIYGSWNGSEDYVPYENADKNVNLNTKNLTNISYFGMGENKVSFNPNVPDSASAVAYSFNTANTLSTRNARFFELKNNGTDIFYIGRKLWNAAYDTYEIRFPTNWARISANSRLDIAAPNVFFTGTFMGFDSALFLNRLVPDPTSTATQKGSRRVVFQQNTWNGTNAVWKYDHIYGDVSTSVDGDHYIAMDFNGDISGTTGTKVFQFRPDGSIYTPNTNLILNSSTGNIYSDDNITTTGYMTATDFLTSSNVADINDGKTALDKLSNMGLWLKEDGTIDYKEHYAFVNLSKQIPDLTKPQTSKIKEEVCIPLEYSGEGDIQYNCSMIDKQVTTYPFSVTIQKNGLSMETRVAQMEKMIYELNEKIKVLEKTCVRK